MSVIKKFLLHSNCQLAENRHVMCVVEKAWFKPRTLGTGAERATKCATAQVLSVIKIMCFVHAAQQSFSTVCTHTAAPSSGAR